jgi:exonuclease SbcC
MIAKARWQNFQSHRDTTIEFDAGVNTLVGLSDSGKTALLRGLIWCTTNKPSGIEFRSYWGGDTSVQMWLDDGTVMVERGRTNDDDNYYALTRDGKTQEFRAFGQGGVPEEIMAAFNMSSVNIECQQDPPYLLSKGSGEVAQELNKAVNLEVIDVATASIRSKKDAVARQLGDAQATAQRLTEELGGFDYLEALEADVQQFEALQTKRQDVCSRMLVLTKSISAIQSVEQDRQKSLAIVAAETALQTALSLQVRQKEGQAKISKLSALTRELRLVGKDYENALVVLTAETNVRKALEIQDERKTCQQKIVRLSDIGFAISQEVKRYEKACALLPATKELEVLTNIRAEREVLKKRRIRLESLSGEVSHKITECQDNTNCLTKLEDEFHAVMPDECPLCGRS